MDEIRTERLDLIEWKTKDNRALYQYAKNPNVGPLAGWKPHESEKESKKIIKSIFIPGGVWKIVLRNEEIIVGTIGFVEDKRRPDIDSKELGYSLDEEFWNMGIMTEAAEAVLDYAFNTMQLEIVSITTGSNNYRSRRVIEKLGFKYEGTERYAYRIYDNTVRDLRCYSIFKKEWQESRSRSL